MSLQVGVVDVTDNPIAEPNAMSTNDNAAAVIAPATTADQFREMLPVSTGAVATLSEVSTAVLLLLRLSAGPRKTERRALRQQDR